MEEAWVGQGRDICPFPLGEAKNMIRQLRVRLVDYLLSVQTEIILNTQKDNLQQNQNQNQNQESQVQVPVPRNEGPGDLGVNIIDGDNGPTYFGNAFGNNIMRFDDEF